VAIICDHLRSISCQDICLRGEICRLDFWRPSMFQGIRVTPLQNLDWTHLSLLCGQALHSIQAGHSHSGGFSLTRVRYCAHISGPCNELNITNKTHLQQANHHGFVPPPTIAVNSIALYWMLSGLFPRRRNATHLSVSCRQAAVRRQWSRLIEAKTEKSTKRKRRCDDYYN